MATGVPRHDRRGYMFQRVGIIQMDASKAQRDEERLE
jgi:hypothetical protein